MRAYQTYEIKNTVLLSSNGNEVNVYLSKDSETVFKYFKNKGLKPHKSSSDLELLASLNTCRIIMPNGIIYHNDTVIGYTMPYIEQTKSLNIYKSDFATFISHIYELICDCEILNDALVRLSDVNCKNSIYNGNLYIIDPGNYFVGEQNDNYFKYYNGVDYDTKRQLVAKWNYDIINNYLIELLFMKNPDVDLEHLKMIIDFFIEKRKIMNISSDIEIYKKYFNYESSIEMAVNEFISDYIDVKDDVLIRK